MVHIQFTLFAEGTTDRALLPILEWLIRETHQPDTVGHEFLPKSELRVQTMAERIQTALELFPCDILFVHRDADKQSPELRYAEVNQAMTDLSEKGLAIPCLCVVPIRMTEAWLLLGEHAIRKAAGNPNGAQDLQLPKAKHVESIPDPKATLYEVLRIASGKSGRRRASFDVQAAAALVPEFAASFDCLRQLSAFARLETDLRALKPKWSK